MLTAQENQGLDAPEKVEAGHADLELLTMIQVAKLLQVSKMKAYSMLEAGDFPHVKIGEKSFRVRKVDLQNTLRRKTSVGR